MPQIVGAAKVIWGAFKAIGAIKLIGGVTIGSLVTQAVVGLGLNLAMKVIAGKPRQNAGAAAGDAQTVQTDPNYPRQVLLGRFACAGSYVTHFSWSSDPAKKPNERVAIVLAIADHACSAFLGGWWGDRRMTIDPVTGAVAEARVGGVDHLWIRAKLGAWNQAADAVLVANSGGRWTSNDRGRGVTYVVVEALYNEEAHPKGLSGLFDFLFEFDGAPLYDRRKDSTAGGSGAHRANDATTWQHTDNAAAVVDALLRGFSAEDEGQANLSLRARDVFFGGGLSVGDLPAAETIAALNACDEAVSLKAGGTEKRYRAAGMISCADAPEGPLRDILAAMAGDLLHAPGRWVIRPGVARTAERTLTEDDVRVDVAATYNRELPREQRVNAVYGRFSDPAQLYRPIELPPRLNPAAEARDGGRRPETLDLAMSPSATQSQRVMEIALRRHLQMQQAEFSTAPEHGDLEGADVVTLAMDDFAFTGRLTTAVTRTGEDDLLTHALAVREEAPSTYAWTPALDEASRGDPADMGGVRPPAAAPTALSVTPYLTTGDDGAARPGLLIAWERVQDPSAVGVRLNWRVVGSATGFARDLAIDPWSPTTQQLRAEEGIGGGRVYEARAAILYRPEREPVFGAWTPAGAATGSTLAAGAGYVLGPDGQPLTGGDLTAVRAYAADTIKSTFSSLTGLTAVNAAIATVGSGHSVSFTPSGAGSTTYLQWALARPGGRAHRVRLRIRAVGADITAAMWDGRMTYSTPSLGHSLTAGRFASIPFPAGGLPAGQWRDIEFQADGLTDYLDSTINQLRFYLVKPASGRIDVGRIEAGYAGGATEGARAGTDLFRTDGVTPMTQAEVRTPEGTSAFVAGQTDWATLGLPTTRLSHLDNSGNLASLERVAARDLALLTGRTANHLSYVGGGGLSVESLRPGEAGANVTEGRTSAFVFGQAPAATDPTIVPGAGRVFTGEETVDRTPGDYQSLISGNGTRFEAKLPASIGVTEVADVLSVVQVDKVGSGSANIIMTLRSRDGVIFQRRGSNASNWAAWHKQFGRQSRPTFDAGDLLDIGSTVASRANFRTDLGTSAFVFNQGVLAVLNAVGAAHINPDAVGQTHVASGTFTRAQAAFTAGAVNWVSNDNEQQMQELLDVEVARGEVLITASVNLNVETNQNTPFKGALKLYRNGVEVSNARTEVWSLITTISGSFTFNGAPRQVTINFIDTPPPGTHDYSIGYAPRISGSATGVGGSAERRYLAAVVLEG